MQFLKTGICFVLMAICMQYLHAQTSLPVDSLNLTLLSNKHQFIKRDTGYSVDYFNRNVCKNFLFNRSFIPKKVTPQKPIVVIEKEPTKPKFISIHGNIEYDFFYRSKLDTPIAQQNLQQHTEKVYLNMTFKEKYPFKVAFVLRQSNSPYFRNFADINFHFDQYAYHKNIKQEVLNKLSKLTEQLPDLKAIEALIKDKEKQLLNLKSLLESPTTLQKIIEERERIYALQLPRNNIVGNNLVGFNRVREKIITKISDLQFDDPYKNKRAFADKKIITIKEKKDSLVAVFSQLYERKKKESDSLMRQVKLLYKKADSVKNTALKKMADLRQKIYKAKDEKEILKLATANGISTDARDKFEKKLSAIKNFSIGRSMINYTELTAQNITITGLNVAYNPSYYVAFAAGKVDYRFRDFFNKNVKSNGQYLVLGRMGLGNPEKNALILTVFKGRKNTNEYQISNGSNSINNQVNIVGYSIESILKKDENTSISFEIAKSTKPVTGNLQTNKQINALWQFNDQTNLGVNIKAQTIIPQTNTKLSGYYRKTGENFQSFSLFSYNTDQTAWLARADQYLLKEKVNITGMLRRNDFTNPFTEKTYKTSTIFKSILVNIRIPKYPSLSFGYYPGSQLYIVNKEKVKENAYYILSGSLAYGYFYKGTGMNSSLIYNQYFNQATDSGFVLYNGISYYGMQTIFLKKLQLQAGFSYNKRPELEFYTMEASGDYALKQFLKIGAGIKYNKISGGNNYWGERLQLSVDFKQLGSVQFQYEKSYLPTINQTLYPIDIGRVSWYKYF